MADNEKGNITGNETGDAKQKNRTFNIITIIVFIIALSIILIAAFTEKELFVNILKPNTGNQVKASSFFEEFKYNIEKGNLSEAKDAYVNIFVQEKEAVPEAKKYLKQKANEHFTDYKEDDVNYADAINKIEIYKSMAIIDDADINELIDKINEINASRIAYRSAEGFYWICYVLSIPCKQ